jgi:hypothetical protein
MPSGSGPILTCRFLGDSELAALGAEMVFVFSTLAWDGGVQENERYWLCEASCFSNRSTERSGDLDFNGECDVREQNLRANACVTVLHCCVTGAEDRIAAQEGRKRAMGRALLIMM